MGNSQPTENPQLITGTQTQIAAASFKQNFRFPGQYFDAESGKHQNHFREYDPIGRYVTSDPIGLKAGLSTYGYSLQSPIRFYDSMGLFTGRHHSELTLACADECPKLRDKLPLAVVMVDYRGGSQSPDLANQHAMCKPGQKPEEGLVWIESYINYQVGTCTLDGLARALHAKQDSFAAGHRGCRVWDGSITLEHLRGDIAPDEDTLRGAREATCALIRQFKDKCKCAC